MRGTGLHAQPEAHVFAFNLIFGHGSCQRSALGFSTNGMIGRARAILKIENYKRKRPADGGLTFPTSSILFTPFLQISRSPRARWLNLLQSLLRNRGSCPWKVRAGKRWAACALRGRRRRRAIVESKDARRPDFRRK